jgi:hypothetical protein
MIIGIAMQHPSSAALPPLDHNGEHQKAPVDGEDIKEGSTQPTSVDEEQAPSYPHHEHPQPGQVPMMHNVMNGSAPPAHVYVSDPLVGQQQQHHDMMGQLEAQFSQFDMQAHQAHMDQLGSSGHNSNSDINNAEDHDGEETEDDPVKLFVGQVRNNLISHVVNGYSVCSIGEL